MGGGIIIRTALIRVRDIVEHLQTSDLARAQLASEDLLEDGSPTGGGSL